VGETRFDLKSDSSEVVNEIEKTAAAFRELREAARSVKGDLDGVAAGTKRAKAETSAISRELAGLKKVAGGLGLGGTFNDIEDLAGGMGSLHPATALASVAVVGLAMDMKLLQESVAFVVGATLQVEDLTAELQRLQGIEGFEPIDPELQSSVRDATAAYAALGAIADELTVIIGAGWAPTVERATEAGVRLGMVAIDIERSFSDVANGTSDWTTELVELWGSLGRIDERSNELIDTMRREELAASVLEMAQGNAGVAAKEAGTVAADAHREGERRAREHERAVREADRAYRELMGTARDLNTAFKKGEDERAKGIAANATLNTKVADDEQARRLEAEQLAQTAQAAFMTRQADMAAAVGETTDANRQSTLDLRAEQIATFAAGANQVVTLADNIAGALKEGSEAQKTAAMIAFRAQQASATAQLVLNTAQAMGTVLATTPPPAVPFVMGFTLAQAAAAAAAIASAPAPKFHTGKTPDERNATILESEAVMTPAAVRRMGGPRAVKDLNRGGSGGGGNVVVRNVYRQRMYGQMFVDASRQAGPVRTELRKGRRPAGRSERHITIHQGDL
jgi:hypothetical protein